MVLLVEAKLDPVCLYLRVGGMISTKDNKMNKSTCFLKMYNMKCLKVKTLTIDLCSLLIIILTIGYIKHLLKRYKLLLLSNARNVNNDHKMYNVTFPVSTSNS